MKLFNKKISLGMGLAALFVVSSVVYSLGYKIAMAKFNRVVSSNQEKQKLYGSLSEIDYNIRNEYIGSVDEDKILNGIYSGYISGLEDQNCEITTKEKYAQTSVKSSSEVAWDLIDESIGYLKCGVLSKDSAEMLEERLKYFKDNRIKNIVLDLRNSQNGDFQEVFKFLEYISPEGHLIYRVDKKGEREVVSESLSPGVDFNFAVVVNNKTSGASEVLAMGMRDFLNAKIVGNKTLGNTIRKKAVDISENLVIVFPDSKYVSFKGTDIYNIGINPDKTAEIEESAKEKLVKGELPYGEDNQLQSAINLLKG